MSRRRTLVLALVAACSSLPVADAAAAKRVFGERHLEQGMRGRDVRVLQDFLTRVGVQTPVDGRFGPHTRGRVRAWETAVARRADGRVTRVDARVLRSQIEAGQTITPPAAPTGGTPLTAAPPAPDVVSPATPAAASAKATLGPDGRAIAPESAPPAVKALIEGANRIHDKPYRYGGGHGRWEDSGYDCSGSMSFAMHVAGLLPQALDSSGFMRFGAAGPGHWVTIYANPGHSYMVIAGLRFDTSGRAEDNSRWDTTMRPAAGHTVRHPPGL